MARQRVVRHFERTKRGNVWFSMFSLTVATTLAAGSRVLVSSLNAAGLALRPFTIVRTRGFVWVASDQIAATEQPMGAMGMQVVTDSASAAGAASVPTPTSEPNADFFVYQPWAVQSVVADATGIDANAGHYFDIDSKSMRKVGQDDDVVLTFENFSLVDGVEFIIGGRFLVKLL